MVVIGVEPHKASHTAVAIDGDERPIARLSVRADRQQVERLMERAEPLDDQRTWGVESAGGLGRLLAQQLVAAGEYVVDVPATLTAQPDSDETPCVLNAAGPPVAAGEQSGTATDKGCFVRLPRPPGHQRCGGLGASRLAHILPTCRAPHSSCRTPGGAV